MKSLDYRVFVALRTRFHFQPLQLIFTALSVSGNWGLFWIGLALAFWAAGVKYGFFLTLFVPFAVYLTLLVNNIIKVSLKRERPAMDSPALAPLGGVLWSTAFTPSHADMSLAATVVSP